MFQTLTKREKFLVISAIELTIDMYLENKSGFDEYTEHFNINQGRLTTYLSVLALGEIDKIINAISETSYKELNEIINHQSKLFDKLAEENEKIESYFNRMGNA